MASIAELLKIRGKLKSTEIVTTLPSGEVRIEKRSQQGDFQESVNPPEISNRRKKKVEYLKRCGFVVDLEPDLKVGEAMPHVYFGSQDVAADLEILQKFKISHILNVGTGIPNHFPTKFEYLKIDILDLPETKIIDHFQTVFPWIDKAIQNGNVFIHCNAGISRSATITVAYIMRSQKIKLQRALEICKSQRDIRPNTGFAKQLEEYETILNL